VRFRQYFEKWHGRHGGIRPMFDQAPMQFALSCAQPGPARYPTAAVSCSCGLVGARHTAGPCRPSVVVLYVPTASSVVLLAPRACGPRRETGGRRAVFGVISPDQVGCQASSVHSVSTRRSHRLLGSSASGRRLPAPSPIHLGRAIAAGAPAGSNAVGVFVAVGYRAVAVAIRYSSGRTSTCLRLLSCVR